jgi:hypothetical protein
MVSTPIIAKKEWEVIFTANPKWRIGVYRPQHRDKNEITELEQHTCPESFILLAGNLTMVYRNAIDQIVEKILEPMELTTFTEAHSGYSHDGTGIALVIEDAGFETQYTSAETGLPTRKVVVVPTAS